MSTKKKNTNHFIKPCQTCPWYSNKRVDTNSEPPSFSLKHLQKGYHLDDCTKEEKLAFLATLQKHSKLSWSELEQAVQFCYLPDFLHQQEALKRQHFL